jgi:hypothetical protein
LVLFNATRSLIWRGPLDYVPWHKSISNLSTSLISSPIQGKPRSNPNPNS